MIHKNYFGLFFCFVLFVCLFVCLLFHFNFCLKKFSTRIWRLTFTITVTLNLSNDRNSFGVFYLLLLNFIYYLFIYLFIYFSLKWMKIRWSKDYSCFCRIVNLKTIIWTVCQAHIFQGKILHSCQLEPCYAAGWVNSILFSQFLSPDHKNGGKSKFVNLRVLFDHVVHCTAFETNKLVFLATCQ